ncbi:MAG: DsbA family protein [Microgenomates group bacterium]
MAQKSPDKIGFFEKFAPALLLLTVALAFTVGLLWQKVSSLEKDGTKTTTTTAAGPKITKLTADQIKKVTPVNDKDHIRGSKDAEIVIVEYSDLQCPYCKQFHPVMEQVFSNYEGKVAWVYRNFPLDTIHPRAKPAANASECVASLAGNNAFSKFVDLVFSDQTKYLTDEGLVEAAVVSGAKKADFQSCYKANKFASLVDAQYQSGVTAGVTGTPTSFVINKKGEMWVVPAAFPFENLKSTIDEALK